MARRGIFTGRTDEHTGGGVGLALHQSSRTFRSIVLLMVLALLAAVLTFASASAPANAAPGTPGTPQAGSVLYQEDFQNGTGITPLPAYASTGGATYTADPYWLDTRHCNGFILSDNDAVPGATDCDQYAPGGGSQAPEYSAVRAKAYALGLLQGLADPGSNRALSTNTTGGDTTPFDVIPNQIEFATSQLSLPSATGRYITFSVDAAATSCQLQAPLLRFYLRTADGQEIPVSSSPINPCSDAGSQRTTVPVTTSGQTFNFDVGYGRFAANGSVLLSNTNSFGIVLRNESNAAGNGNDGAIDNIRILDATPQLDKSFSPTSVKTGGTSTLTFTITNTSDLAAKDGWSFTDTLPAGLTLASPAAAATTCPAGVVTAADGGTSVTTTGNLDAGMASCTVTVNVTSSTVGDYTNGPGNVTETGLNPPGPSTVRFSNPELTLLKHAGTPVDVNGNGITDAGDTIQYTFDVTNSGDVPITNVAVNDAKAGTVTCPDSSLSVGASETCSADAVYPITAADASSGAVDNSATATGNDPTNATITSSPSTTHTPVMTAAPALTVVKSADPSSDADFTPGQTIMYNFVVTNTGNVAMNEITIDEGAFSGTGAMSAATCPESTLAVGAQEVCTATYTLTDADVNSGSVTNTATVEGTPPGSNTSVPSDPSTVVVPTPPHPAISLDKSADPGTVANAGETVTYSFLVTNTGNVTMSNVKIDEGAFSGSGTLSAVECPSSSLLAGQAETCTATYEVTQADVDAGTLSNTATAEGTPPGSDTSVPSDPSTSTVVIPANPGITVQKSSSATAAAVNEQITYSFLVTNTGNVTLTDPQVTDSDFSGTGTLSAITCPPSASTLEPGDGVTCTATYTVTQADVDSGELTNTATATGTPPGTTPPPVSPPSTIVVPTNPHPALSVVKSANQSTLSTVGQVVIYTFQVTNTGNVTIDKPVVHDTDFSGTGRLSAITCPTDTAPTTLAPGAAENCTATYAVTHADLVSGKLSNSATVTGTTSGGDPVTSDPSSVTVKTVVPVAPAGLASTGSDLFGPILGGAGILLAGLIALLAAAVIRRRKAGPAQS